MSSVNTVNLSKNFQLSEADICFSVRAKYIPDASGALRLTNICSAPRPVFHLENWEDAQDYGEPFCALEETGGVTSSPEELAARSIRRAKEAAFDLVLCNQFDWFSTLTFSPEHIDRTDYQAAYGKIKTFFSNLVQRHDFMYLAVPEHHKDGEAIHFHLLSNGGGLELVRSGHYRKGKPVFNISNWRWGFSTALRVDGEDCRDKCAKYIFKYMGKQMNAGGAKIGGRYYLSGGDLVRPVFVYGDSVDEFMAGNNPTYSRTTQTPIGEYTSLSFI